MTVRRPLFDRARYQPLDLRSVGAWYLLTLARDGKREEFSAHGGGEREWSKCREVLGLEA